MARYHRMTARRKVALKKAQLASARKRHRKGLRIARNIAIGTAAVGAVAIGANLARNEYKYHWGADVTGQRHGASRRHFQEANAMARAQYQQVGLAGMTPHARGIYTDYRYARAQARYERLGGPRVSHGLIHRSGLHHSPSMRRRIHNTQRRAAAHGHRIRTI